MAFMEKLTYTPTTVTNYQTAEEFIEVELRRGMEDGDIYAELDVDGTDLWQQYRDAIIEVHANRTATLDVETQVLSMVKTWPDEDTRDQYYIIKYSYCDENHPLHHGNFDIIKSVEIEIT